MKLEDQVCSLELAKKMKELKIDKESLFYWVYQGDQFDVENKFWDIYEQGDFSPEEEFVIPAYTASELADMLPMETSIVKMPFGGRRWGIVHIKSHHTEKDDKFTDALAKMVIYLEENKLKEVKNDLPNNKRNI